MIILSFCKMYCVVKTCRGMVTTPLSKTLIKGALDKCNIIHHFILFSKKLRFSLREVLAKVMTACWFLHSSSAHFLRNVDICSNFYFLKLTSIKQRIKYCKITLNGNFLLLSSQN